MRSSAPDADQPGQPPPTPPDHAARPAILIIENDPAARRLISLYLTRHGYTCLQAADSAAAHGHLAASAIGLAILDLHLSGHNREGLTLLRAIHADPDHATLPIILMTGERGADLTRLAKEAGAAESLFKPFNLPDLLALVRRHLPDAH